jgi:hypothetical protein
LYDAPATREPLGCGEPGRLITPEIDVNAAGPPIDWMMLLAVAASGGVMVFLFRRMMRGMNQQDWILLRHARARGIDPAVPQRIDFVLFFARAEAADSAIAQLATESYEASRKLAHIQYARNRRKPGTPQEGYLVTGRKMITLRPADLIKVRSRMNELAAAHEGIYCGWQVATAPTQQDAPPVRN